MKLDNKIFLPGSDKQVNRFLSTVSAEGKSVLIIGGGSEEIAEIFLEQKPIELFFIVDDEDSLFQSRFIFSEKELRKIEARLMDYSNTDFREERFDIVYSQGSAGTTSRNKIIKEIKRILKPGGYFCTGEIVSKSKDVPRFVRDSWESSSLLPLYESDFKKYYNDKGFEVILEEDLSFTLNDFYKTAGSITQRIKDLSDSEKSFFKKILNKMNHESNVYLKLGGDKYIGLRMIVLKKM